MKSSVCAALSAVLLASSQSALASLAVPVSEPSVWGLLAAGVVAAFIGRRFYRNK